MKINWFSPLPPAYTDVAHYTMRILPELASNMEVILWTDQPKWDERLEDYAKVQHYEPHNIGTTLLKQADIIIYNIGNNVDFYGTIWEVSKLYPGIVILHDQSLFELVAQYYISQQNGKQHFYSIIEKYCGNNGLKSIDDFEKGLLSIDYLAEYYPMVNYVLGNSIGVFVHTRDGFDQLSREDKWPIGYAPLPYRASPISVKSLHKKYDLGDPYRIVIFGYLGNNRRLGQVLQALSELSDKNRFRLDIYGKIFDLRGVKEKIRSLGLRKLVNVHGYVPEQELDAALDNAHLAINLRFRSRGEASGSQLRIWDRALPSLVTNTKWYSTLSEKAVKFVSPGTDEIWDIKVLLKDFLSDPKAYAEMGKSGRQILEQEHQPSSYAESLLHFCQHILKTQNENYLTYYIKRVADEVLLWDEKLENSGQIRNTASQIFDLCKR